MEFSHGGMILAGHKVSIGKGQQSDPDSFEVPNGGGGAIIRITNWQEHNGQLCINAGIDLMNSRADDVVTPTEIVRLVQNLYPSANFSQFHLNELGAALEQLQAAKTDGKITILEGLGMAGTLLPALLRGDTANPKGVVSKVTDFFGGLFGSKKK